MRNRQDILWFLCAILLVTGTSVSAQNDDLNTITTAVPFARIVPDARTGALGDAGIATTPDANAVYVNPSKLAFIAAQRDKKYGFSMSFVPWLKGLVNDVYFAYVTGYATIRDVQAVSAALSYSSLGNIQFTDNVGNEIREGRPRELTFAFQYARQLTERFGLAAGLRYIYSNLDAAGTTTIPIEPSMAASADISMFYTTPIKLKGDKLDKMTLNWGLALTNIGSKMSYSGDAAVKDFIPANFGTGLGIELKVKSYHKILFALDINKLMVPTPDTTDTQGEVGVPDYKEKSSIGAVFTSWADAPGGFKEELKEFTIGTGVEYWYNDIVAFRLGYFYEHPDKGARKYLVAGGGLKYSVVGLDISYVIPTSAQRHPLDNTMRFSLLFDFNSGGLKATETPSDDEFN